MKKKLNCWDYKKCCKCADDKSGDICPVREESIADGLNGGINGGRICWVIMDSHCKKKSKSACFQCEFHYKVITEEGLLNNCNAIGAYLGKRESDDDS